MVTSRRPESLRHAQSSSLGSQPPSHGRMCFRVTTPDWRTPRRNCRIDPAARSSRPPRPPRHHQNKRAAEAPRSRRLNELAADLTDKRLASSRPRSSDPAYSSDLEIVVTRTPHLALIVRQSVKRWKAL